MADTQLCVGLIGAGGIARDEHLPAWLAHPRADVVAVADTAPAALQAVERQFNIVRCETDYRTLLDDPAIDVIDVCVPSALHAEVTTAALAAGKHVLCEKPMATSVDDTQAMLAAWRASGKKLMIGQHLRFDRSVETLRRWLLANSPGPIYFAHAQWRRRRRLPGTPGFTHRPLSGGGVLYDLGVHMLDLAWWLMGCPRPLVANGMISQRLARRDDLASEWGIWNPATIDVEDFAAGWLRFDGGGVVSLDVSWLALQTADEFRRLELLGEQAGVVWPDRLIAGETNRQPWNLSLHELPGLKPHRAVVHHFADAVLNDTEVAIPPEQSATVIAMLDGLYRSAAGGCEVALAKCHD